MCEEHLAFACGALVPHGASFIRWKRKEQWIDSPQGQDAGSVPGLGLRPFSQRCWEYQSRFQLAGQLISPSPGSQSLPTWSRVPTLLAYIDGRSTASPFPLYAPNLMDRRSFGVSPQLQSSLAAF